MIRFILVALCALMFATPVTAQSARDQRVVFVMLDGLRWQEVFRGADTTLAGDAAYMGSAWVPAARKDYVDVADRRAALMPFLTEMVAKEGALIGDRDHGSCAAVTNNMWFSYPGYNEALTGKADPRINSNDYPANPNVTFLEWLNKRQDFAGRVRAVTAWDAFTRIINIERSGVPVNAGFAAVETRDPALQMLNRLQADATYPWDIVRPDSFTHQIVLDTLRRHHPRAMFISYGETDDFAHEGNYAQYLISAHRGDRFLREIWETLQADRFYAGRTTLIVTVDHGRGNVGEGWRHHSSAEAIRQQHPERLAQAPDGIVGSNETWMAVMGPRVRAGVASVGAGQCAGTNQIAATALTALGLDWRQFDADAGAPLDIFSR